MHKLFGSRNGRQHAPFIGDCGRLFCVLPVGSPALTEIEDRDHELEDDLDANSWPLRIVPPKSSVALCSIQIYGRTPIFWQRIAFGKGYCAAAESSHM